MVTTPCHTPVPWHFTGIYRALPVSRLPSEDQRKTGCSVILGVDTDVWMHDIGITDIRQCYRLTARVGQDDADFVLLSHIPG